MDGRGMTQPTASDGSTRRIGKRRRQDMVNHGFNIPHGAS
jgi:hypothetical protein